MTKTLVKIALVVLVLLAAGYLYVSSTGFVEARHRVKMHRAAEIIRNHANAAYREGQIAFDPGRYCIETPDGPAVVIVLKTVSPFSGELLPVAWSYRSNDACTNTSSVSESVIRAELNRFYDVTNGTFSGGIVAPRLKLDEKLDEWTLFTFDEKLKEWTLRY